MSTESQTQFAKAASLHQQGKAAEAIPLYRKAIKADSKNLGAVNLLAVALMQTQQLKEAADTLEAALQIDPTQPNSQFNLGVVLQQLGECERAIEHYKQAIALKPGDASMHNNLGVAYKTLGQYEEASKSYRQAIALNSTYIEAQVNLAISLYHLNQYEEAIRRAQKALALNPNLAEAHICIGNALIAQDHADQAIQAFEKAIALQPGRPEAYESIGNLLASSNFHARAIEYYEKTIVLKPSGAATFFKLADCLFVAERFDEAAAIAEKGFAWGNKDAEDDGHAGMYLLRLNRLEEAERYFQNALKSVPDSVPAHIGLGNTLQALNRHDEAIVHFEQALQAKPDDRNTAYNMSLLYLALGRFAEGWPLYETRFSQSINLSHLRAFPFDRWNGETLPGRLVIWGEQGLGDQIIYSSMIADALKYVQNISLMVSRRLIPLMTRSFPGVTLIPLGEDSGTVEGAAHIPFGSLGAFLRKSWSDFPQQAYLKADKERAEKLRERLHAEDKTVIGLSWRSANPKFGMHKSAQISDFVPLLKESSIAGVDLQYGDTTQELKNLRESSGISIRHVDEIDNMNDVDGLASLIEACDLVVTVSNTTAHMAGALGKPVWILLPQGQGKIWYWFKDRRDSPWYPNARIIRQQQGQSWSELIASITPEILDFARKLKPKN